MGRTACTEPQCLYKGALYLSFLVEEYEAMGTDAFHPRLVHHKSNMNSLGMKPGFSRWELGK